MKKDIKWAIAYPLAAWLVFYFIAFVTGFTPWPDLSQALLLSDTEPFFTAIMIGLWIGIESHRTFDLKGAIINSFLVSLIVGLAVIALTATLVNHSQIFLTYSVSIYSRYVVSNTQPILNLALSTLAGNIFVAVPGAIVGYELLDKIKKRERPSPR